LNILFCWQSFLFFVCVFLSIPLWFPLLPPLALFIPDNRHYNFFQIEEAAPPHRLPPSVYLMQYANIMSIFS
jgi:hypothetical protein